MENNFTPIAMLCNKEQFDAIKPILKEHGMEIRRIDSFISNPYLITNYNNQQRTISNIGRYGKSHFHRTTYEEWNQDLFLRCCGIDPDIETKTEMKTYNIKISDLKKIHDVAYGSWRAIIKALITDPFAESIELSQSQVDEMFKAAQDHQRPVLVEVFGEPVSQCLYKKGQLLWVWDNDMKYLNVRVFIEMEGSRFVCVGLGGGGTCYWDNAAPFNNGQLPDQFKHLLDNQ